MGIEDTTLDVEETTEPPIRGPVANSPQKDAGTTLTSTLSSVTTTDDGKEGCGFKDAHTVPAAIVARVLGVDPQ